MNNNNILFHNIIWFLRDDETSLLLDIWENQIKENIISGYLEGEFEVEINNSTDSLIWRIDRT
jgi:hypothetical protein